jgi:hypothetical protein
MDLSFTTAAGPRQGSNSLVRVPRDSWSCFAVSDSRLPQPGGPGSHIYIYIYIPQQGGPVIPSSTGFRFRRLLRLAGLRWRYSNPPPHGMTQILADPRVSPNRKHRSFLYAVSTGMCLRRPAKGCLPRICYPSNGAVTLFRRRGNVFTEPLPSNDCLHCFHDSGFRASCHSTVGFLHHIFHF